MLFFKSNKVNINGLSYYVDKVTKKKMITLFDDDFPKLIIMRGKDYYKNNKVINYKYENNIISSDVLGSKTYHVDIIINHNKIKEFKCTCPYYENDGFACKHIYATLLKYSYEEDLLKEVEYEEDVYILNKKDTYKKYKNIIKKLNDKLKEINEYMSSLKDGKEKTELISKRSEFINSIKEYSKYTVDDMSKDIIDNGQRLYGKMKYSIPEIIKINIKVKNEEEERVPFYKMFNDMDLHIKTDEERKKEELEKEMDAYELEEWQKELVRKGDYNPNNFDSEELEEEDYYYDDSW